MKFPTATIPLRGENRVKKRCKTPRKGWLFRALAFVHGPPRAIPRGISTLIEIKKYFAVSR